MKRRHPPPPALHGLPWYAAPAWPPWLPPQPRWPYSPFLASFVKSEPKMNGAIANFSAILNFSQSSCYIPFGGNNPSKAKILKISEKGWFSLSMGL
jgi:hypothetical protein